MSEIPSFIPRLRRRILAWQSAVWRLLGGSPAWWRRQEESDRAHAATVVDLFASILARQLYISAGDADAALDILRYNFPDVEHSWLARRFERSLQSQYSLEDALGVAAAGRSDAERVSLALEVLALIRTAGDRMSEKELFEEVTFGLMLPGMAPLLERLLDSPDAKAEPPVESVSFSPLRGQAEVSLPSVDDGVRFRVLRCLKLMLVINDGDVPFMVRGRTLFRGRMVPLSTGQFVVLPSGPVGYGQFEFYLQAKRSGVRVVYYLHLEQGSLQVSRFRSRGSDVRMKLGLDCELEVLRHDAECRVGTVPVHQGEPVRISYFDPFTLKGEGPFVMAEIRNATRDTGNSFLLDPGTRKIRVTNLPHRVQHGDLLLTPGLSPGVLFEVVFSKGTNTGMLHVIESSANMTVRDLPVRTEMLLKDGDLIRLSPYQSLRCHFSLGVLDEESNTISTLAVEGLTKDFSRAGRVVDNIDFTASRGEMTCILGPSGSGKSTLLALLAGHLPPTRGRIRYNDELLSRQTDKLRRYIAYIPREDILDEAMTVEEHIYQASIIRRPRLSRLDRRRRVQAILNYIGLGHLASRRVGRAGERIISDGERTRLNLGLDLTGAADVFLVDEPISGLASGDAERVIDTLETMTRDKVVIVTLHRPSPGLLQRFDKVLVLDHGGQMAYWGNPAGMMEYFRRAAQEMGIAVSPETQRSGGADYVFEVLEAPLKWLDMRRRQSPRFWQERYEGYVYRKLINGREMPPPASSVKQKGRELAEVQPRTAKELWRLSRIWMIRTFLGRVRSRMGLYTMILEGPVLALLIATTLRASSTPEYIFKSALHIPPYLFLSIVVAMFFGLTDSASEILKDRPVLKRESNYRPFITGYLGAKVLVLTGISAFQCALYLLVGNTVLGISDMFEQYWLVMVLTSFVGIALSLMVSAFVRTERTALNIVPLLLVPQILLAGAMIPFNEMNQFLPWSAHRADENGRLKPGRVPLVAELCPLRYAYEMLVVTQATGNPWEIERRKVHARVEELKKKPGVLSTAENAELRRLLRALAAMSSLEAADEKEAKLRIRAIRREALGGASQKAFDGLLEEFEQPGKGSIPMADYYVNDRILGIFELAEAQRQSRNEHERPGIFLAERQPVAFMGDGLNPDDPGYSADHGTVSTLQRDGFYLAIMGLIPLLLAGWRIRIMVAGRPR